MDKGNYGVNALVMGEEENEGSGILQRFINLSGDTCAHTSLCTSHCLSGLSKKILTE